MPVPSPLQLTTAQKKAVWSINLRHLLHKSIIEAPTQTPIPTEHSQGQLEPQILPGDLCGMQLQYPELEAELQDPLTPVPNSVPSGFLESVAGDLEPLCTKEVALEMEELQYEQREAAEETLQLSQGKQMDVDEIEEEPNIALEDYPMEALDQEGSAVKDGDVAPGPIKGTTQPPQVAPSVSPPPPTVPRCPPTVPNPLEPPKTPPSPHSLFLPKKSAQRPHNPSKRARAHTPDGKLRPPNWTSTARASASTRNDLHTANRPPLLELARKGRKRARHVENYRIQDDRTAKHPPQRAAPQSLAQKQAGDLIAAVEDLLAHLKTINNEQLAPGYREVVKAAGSSFDDFHGCRERIRLEVLKSNPALLQTVANFASFREVVEWPHEVKELKQKAKEIDKAWQERFRRGF